MTARPTRAVFFTGMLISVDLLFEAVLFGIEFRGEFVSDNHVD